MVAGVDVVCELSQELMLALSPRLVLSKGIGWPFGRCIWSLIRLARLDTR